MDMSGENSGLSGLMYDAAIVGWRRERDIRNLETAGFEGIFIKPVMNHVAYLYGWFTNKVNEKFCSREDTGRTVTKRIKRANKFKKFIAL